ncbi:hypothetical protein [Endozoicomonas sp. 8E]|uniref:hypothetical protein n=1 Tax=Endozoicomonas sp. 8E TaxID=3035692 RepID=UPI0029394C5D|nr:hypothetical protein [Endozoicomonas sp. 8E]WOG29400.1 hypothetical protein P6910_07060 [Endozoicomonas sp. 8E]
MDASSSQSLTVSQPLRSLDTGNELHSRRTSGRSTTFNTRNVTRADNPSCKLTVYLDNGHSFVRLENKDRGVDITRGLYPARFVASKTNLRNKLRLETLFNSETFPVSPLLSKLSRSAPVEEVQKPRVDRNQCPVVDSNNDKLKSKLYLTYAASLGAKLAGRTHLGRALALIGVHRTLFSKMQGRLSDETLSYAYEGFDSIPRVTFFISQQEALAVEKYISEYDDACDKGEESCIFQGIGFNCVDFAQEAFSKTDYSGHFIEYFTPSLLSQRVGMAGLYAVGCHLVVKNPASTAGTLMLAVVVGKYAVPRLKEAVRSVGSWICGWVWPAQQSIAATQVDVSELKRLHGSLQLANLYCEVFWENYSERDAEARKLISDSVDLQARFDDLEELIKTEDYNGRHQSFIYKELKNIQDGFTEFFREAADMKNAHNSKESWHGRRA